MSSSEIQNKKNFSRARSHIVKGFVFLLAIVIFMASFTNEAEARRRRKKSKSRKRAAVINEKKLYERMGGTKVVADVVDEWLRLSLADGRISVLFASATAKPDRLAKLRRNLNDQLCELADGPCQYKGPDVRQVSEGSLMDEDQFLAFAEDLFKSLRKFNVPEREKNELLGRLGTLKSEAQGADGES